VIHRIVVTGSESTGKTTLARTLALELRAPWVPEFARDYAAARGGVLSAADVEPIARGQVAREDAAMAALGDRGVLVLDTDLVSTTVYAEHYYGRCPAWIALVPRAYCRSESKIRDMCQRRGVGVKITPVAKGRAATTAWGRRA